MRLPLLVPWLVAALAVAASAQEPAADPLAGFRERADWSATARFEYAFGWHEGETQKAQFVFEPQLDLRLPFEIDLTAITRVRADADDSLEPGDPKQRTMSQLSRRRQLGDHADIELRELYAQTKLGRAYLTLGKQQVVWGRSDGLKVLDLVDPQDFHEFILPAFEDSRTPLWTANAEIGLGNVVAQLLWIPDPTYDQIPESDALFEFTTPRFALRPPPGAVVNVRNPDKPQHLFFDSDAGVRLSTFWKGWDLSLNYLYHYFDRPVVRSRLSFPGGVPTVTVTPDYERTHTAGASFSNAFGDLTLRGEVALSSDRYFTTEDPADADANFRSAEVLYVLGLDWYGFRETLVSLQLFQSVITRRPAGSVRDRVDTTLTLLLRREMWNDRLTFDNIWMHNFNDGDGLLRHKVSYELVDAVNLYVGVDIFYGSRNGVFGQFDNLDRFLLGIEIGL